MTTLVLVNKPISTLSDGHDLRVWHLCRVLAEFETLISVCVPLGENGNAQANEKTLRADDIFLDEIIATNRGPEFPSAAGSMMLQCMVSTIDDRAQCSPCVVEVKRVWS